MQKTLHHVFNIEGYEISATFAANGNTAAITHAKQILLSSYSNVMLTSPNSKSHHHQSKPNNAP